MQSNMKNEARLREFGGPGQQANSVDALRKREQFAVSLRQKKKTELIKAKRQKLTNSKKKVLRAGDVDFESLSYTPEQRAEIVRERAPLLLQFLPRDQCPTLTETVQYILN